MKKEAIILSIIILFLISGCNENEENLFFTPNTTINNTNNSSNINSSINQKNTTNNESNETNYTASCLDTDGGIVYDVKGSTMVSNGKFRQVEDRCENSGLLVEYYCKEDNTLGTELYQCYNSGDICVNGICGGISLLNETNSTNGTNSS